MKRIPHFLITFFFLLMACAPGFSPVSQPGAKPVQQSLWPTEAEFQERIRNKPPYSGAPQVKIAPTLLYPQVPSQAVDLSPALNQPPAFGIQSVQTEALWEQTLQANTGTQTWQISGLDLARRYTLQITKQGSGQAQLSLNLNGTDWLSDNSSLQSTHYFPHLLLYPNNSLRASLSGDPDVSIHLSLHPGGTVPYLLNQRQGTLIRPDDTQASRLQRNDINHFNPALANSLNGLQPYQGHLSADQPVPAGITGISIDGGGSLMFEEGTVILQIEEPDTLLPELIARYGAELIHEINIPEFPQLNTHYLAVDLNTSPLHETNALIRAYREEIPAVFNDFVFASEAGLRTFVILLDILVRYPEQIRNWELNLYEPSPSALNLPPTPANDWDAPAASPTNSYNRGWWLRDTFAREAWQLSLGTGVKVAYIDRGYEHLLTATGSHAEIERERILLDDPIFQNLAVLMYPSDVSAVPGNPLDCKDNIPVGSLTPNTDWCSERTHGIDTLFSGFAQRNNGVGTAGVAPNAQVRPYNTANTWITFAAGLGRIMASVIGGDSIDVVGFNQNLTMYTDWKRFTNANLMFDAIDILINHLNIPVIIAAQNFAENYQTVWPDNDPNMIRVPGHWYGVDSKIAPGKKMDIIIAAGVERDGTKAIPSTASDSRYQPNPSGELRGWLQTHVTPNKGSNVYPNAIWAPANDIEHAVVSGGIARTAGTSFSCPIVTATVALMKSRNPDLTPREILDILRSSPTRVNINHVPPTVLNNQPFLDIQHAVEEAIKKAGKPIQVAQSYPGQIEKIGNQVNLLLNRSIENTGLPPHETVRVLRKSVAPGIWNALNHGQRVSVSGWMSTDSQTLKVGKDNLALSEMEVLDIVPQPAPVIQQAEIHQGGGAVSKFSATHPFEVRIQGEHLAADLAASKSLTLTFHHVGSSANRDFVMDFKQTSERLNNAGTEAVFALDTINDNPGSFLQVGQRYRVSVKGPNGSSNQFPPSSNFEIQTEAASGSGFGVKSIPPDADQLPINSYVYDKTGNRWIIPGQTLSVDPHDFVGIHFEQPIHNLEVKIGPVLVPIIDVLENLAVIGIPDDLPAGVHDAVIKASGQTLTLEQVVSKAAGVIAPYPEPAHVPPSNSPGQQKYLQIDNLSEGNAARVYLNEQLIASVTSDNQPQNLQLGPDSPYPLLTSQRNALRLEVHNNSTSGYTYGFRLSYGDAGYMFKDVQGDVDQEQKVRAANGVIDNRTGLVYQEQIWLHNTGILPVGAGDYWVKVYNLGADDEVLLRASNQIGDIQWPDGEFRVKAQYQTFYRKLPWSQEICLPNGHCWCQPGLDNFCWSENTLQATVFNDTGSYSYAVDVYKGIYLLSRQRDGQPNGWGANYNSQATDSWGVQWLGAKLWKYGVP